MSRKKLPVILAAVGQVWRSNDKRKPIREVVVMDMDDEFAYLCDVALLHVYPRYGSRISLIRLEKRGLSRGYTFLRNKHEEGS